MLKVLFGKRFEDMIYPPMYFDHVYENDWFEDPIVKQMVRDIDKSELQGLCVISPYLGSIAVERLSGGVKSLILMYKEDVKLDLIYLGNNCEDWIIKLANMKDITVCMTGFDMCFENKDIKAICLNDNSSISNYYEWCDKMTTFGSINYEG